MKVLRVSSKSLSESCHSLLGPIIYYAHVLKLNAQSIFYGETIRAWLLSDLAIVESSRHKVAKSLGNQS